MEDASVHHNSSCVCDGVVGDKELYSCHGVSVLPHSTDLHSEATQVHLLRRRT